MSYKQDDWVYVHTKCRECLGGWHGGRGIVVWVWGPDENLSGHLDNIQVELEVPTACGDWRGHFWPHQLRPISAVERLGTLVSDHEDLTRRVAWLRQRIE